MFLSRNKKNNIYPCKPQFNTIKVGFKEVKIIQACFRDVGAPNEDLNQPERTRSLTSLHCLREETLYPRLSKVRPVNILIRLREWHTCPKVRFLPFLFI